MNLSTAQLQSLKTDIAANTNTIPAGLQFGGQAINSLAVGNPDAAFVIAAWYSLVAVPDFNVFQTRIPIDTIANAITYSNFTPSVAIAGDGSNAALWTACSMACQGKQFNLQLLLPAGSTFNAGLISKRAGLNDATTNLPGGAPLGTLVSGGWAVILPLLRRLSLNIEKLFATATTGVGTGTGALGAIGNPGLMNFEGSITGQDVVNAWGS